MGFFGRYGNDDIVDRAVRKTLDDLKGHVDDIYKMANEIDRKARKKGEEAYLRRQVGADLTNFMFYLAIADDNIDEAEVEVINYVLCISHTAQDIMEITQSMPEFYGPEFEKRVPESFSMLTDYAVKHVGREPAYEAGIELASLYLRLGDALADADGRRGQRESSRLIEYTNMLRAELRKILEG